MPSSRRAHACAVLALALVAVACTPEPARPQPLATCSSAFASLSESPVVLRIGQRETLTFNVRVGWNCEGQPRQPEGITVEAVDDEGLDVAVDVLQTRSPPPYADNFALQVTFTTPETSSVAFRLRAEPSLGLIQRSFLAVAPTVPAWEVVATPGTCRGGVEGPGLGLFCFEVPATVRRLTGPTWSRPDVNGLAFTSDALWLFLDGGVAEAWSFDGGVAQRAAASSDTVVPSALHARGNRVVVAGAKAFDRVALMQFEVGAPTRGLVALWPDALVGALRFVSDDDVELARGERLDLVRIPSAPGRGSLELPAPTSPRVTPLSVSPEGLWYGIDPGGRNSSGAAGGGPAGAGGGPASGNQDVQVVRPDGGISRVAMGSVPSWALLPPIHVADAVPLWVLGRTTAGMAVTVVPVNAPDGGLALRYLETSGSELPSWASSRWVFGPATPGRLLRMRREP